MYVAFIRTGTGGPLVSSIRTGSRAAAEERFAQHGGLYGAAFEILAATDNWLEAVEAIRTGSARMAAELVPGFTLTRDMFNALASASDGGLHRMSDTGEWRNRIGVIFDVEACATLAEYGLIIAGPVASVATSGGYEAGVRYDITPTGTIFRQMDPPALF